MYIRLIFISVDGMVTLLDLLRTDLVMTKNMDELQKRVGWGGVEGEIIL